MKESKDNQYKKNVKDKFNLIRAELNELVKDMDKFDAFLNNEESMKYGLWSCRERARLKNRIAIVRDDLLELKKELYKT